MAREHVDEETREEAIRADERRRLTDRDGDGVDDRTEAHEHDHRPEYGPAYVRGGLSLGSILTGTAVAFGTMSLLTILIAGIAVAVGLVDEIDASATQIGWGAGIILVLSQFVAYFWGGYTAGRMARGAGILNGLMVPLMALLLVGGAIGIMAAFGVEPRFAAPFTDFRVPVEEDVVLTWGIGLGIATLVMMFLGGILGGHLGARWHDKLEAVAGERYDARRAA
ncbi:MAG TPA: TIGR04086 family membrane protein [Actinomycetota bacterium]|nr:TIGR04086 family membrane protein [Actinomycetota bacterium]